MPHAKRRLCRRPNILLITTDEERYPPVYETEEVRAWRSANLVTRDRLRAHGMEFHRHYAGATACSPSRATLYTGQYPSLHGVTQTTGAAKGPFDPDVFWLDHSTVPTFGDYFRAGGYRTFWKGKWHASDEDILIPATHNALPSYNSTTGVPVAALESQYLNADRLDPYGFTGWVGPEPHGSHPRNSGASAAVGLSGRDEVYATQVVELIRALDEERATSGNTLPWLIVSSFVNPHDIALYGAFAEQSPLFNFAVDPSVPETPPPPTAGETLAEKPRAQRSYRRIYPQALQPIINQEHYRRLYYSLHKTVDQQMGRVFQALVDSSFYEETVVLFTSDHGDLLGAHGGLHQKWYNVYEESIHVPLIIHNPVLFSQPESVHMLTSHVDIVPTLLGLAGIDPAAAQQSLTADHTEVHPLVGRDLSPLVTGRGMPARAGEPVFFMTDDDMTRGLNQRSVLGKPYRSVVQPNHIEAIIAELTVDGRQQVWKYARYYDNPQFWSDPGCEDQVERTLKDSVPVCDGSKVEVCLTTVKQTPVRDQFELYNLTDDPLETVNLANPAHHTPQTQAIRQIMAELLLQQCVQKRLSPSSGPVPGMPPCPQDC